MTLSTGTTTDSLPLRAGRQPVRLPQALRLALRDLRGGLSGFYVFLACVALGVAVIAGIGALTDALRSSFERQGQTLLGGDISVSRIHTRATDAERGWMTAQTASQGAGAGQATAATLTEAATMRSMARRLDGQSQVLVELKAVDAAYPIYGAVELLDGQTLDGSIRRGRIAAVEPLLLDRLNLKLGDTFRVGSTEITVGALIKREPDQLAERLPFGPRVLVSIETLEATGLVQPGSLIRWFYRLKTPADAGERRFTDFRTALKAAHPEGGFLVVDRRNPSPSVTRSVERLRQFLTLIGLTALLVGGVGVANAVSTFVDRKRKVIATFKSLGASNRLVFTIFLIEVMLLAAMGVLIGLVLGYLLPLAAGAVYGDALPIKLDFSVRPLSLLTASVYGLLVALVFMLWPLGRAEQVRATVLFRDEVAETAGWPRRSLLIATMLLGSALAALAILTSDSRLIAFWFCLGLIGIFAAFMALGAGISRVARMLPRPRMPELALALGNIGGPGSLTRPIVLSLGAGLSLLVGVALANTAIVAEFVERLPANAPTYYVLDITKSEWPAFTEAVRKQQPQAQILDAPMLRGRLVELAGKPVEQMKAPPEAQWVLNGDRGLSFADEVPQGSKVVTGTWWGRDYAGEPLVSFEVELARKLGLKIGDSVVVNVLGRNVTAKISNLREIKWENLTINFVLVFSPNTLKAAPYNLLATITLPAGHTAAEEGKLIQTLALQFPAMTSIRVKDAIDQFNLIFGKVMTAVQVSGGVTLLSGALVLAGALATAQRRRIYQAVVLKTLGATRGRILLSHLIEYLILATLTALIAAVVGTLAAWLIISRVMDLDFVFSFRALAQALGVAIALVLGFGLAGTWRVLSAPTVPYLRSE
jgi:putative ABC transport system permease protein